MEQGTADNLISLFCHKEIVKLYKGFLSTIEDLKLENKIMIDKVAKHCAHEFANDINHFTDERHGQIRKRVLDQGNETARNISAYTEMFDSRINEAKVSSATKRVIVKRFTTSIPAVEAQ